MAARAGKDAVFAGSSRAHRLDIARRASGLRTALITPSGCIAFSEDYPVAAVGIAGLNSVDLNIQAKRE